MFKLAKAWVKITTIKSESGIGATHFTSVNKKEKQKGK
jgi:hypothetical protein